MSKIVCEISAGNTTSEEEQSDRPAIADDDEIKTFANQWYTREIAEILHLSRTIVIENLYKLGYMNHLLSEKNLIDRICNLLL